MNQDFPILAECIHPLGDSALQIDLHQLRHALEHEPFSRDRVITASMFATMIAHANMPGVLDIVPAYEVVTVHFNPGCASAVAQALRLLSPFGAQYSSEEDPITDIPVCYGGEYGPDLVDVARLCNLNTEQVVALHTATVYQVVMLGFTPGFAYLDGLSPLLATPRLDTPRLMVPAGSVGIGGDQTGVYPSATPGGWRLIGTTPLALFDSDTTPPCLLRAGAQVRFVAISVDRYNELLEQGA